MFLESLSRRRDLHEAAHAIYHRIVVQARDPAFYRDFGVPDTVEGRFEMIALHAFLVLHRLKRVGVADGPADSGLGQALFDMMFNDMDRNMREMGVGDLGVGRRVKKLAKAFYGRIAAYESGFAEGEPALSSALALDLYGGSAPEEAPLAMARYMIASRDVLAELPFDEIAAGGVAFAPVPVPAVVAAPAQVEEGEHG